MKKFGVVIGNPPYQDDNELSTRKTPIYNLFMDEANKLADKVELITPARFLFNAGQTPKKWNEERLNDPKFKVLCFEQKASNFFPNTDIKGGVAITYRDENKNFGPIRAFISFKELNSILQKVLSSNPAEFLDALVSSQGIYKYTTHAFEENSDLIHLQGKGTGNKIVSKSFAADNIIFTDEKPDSSHHYISLIGLKEKKRQYRFIKAENVENNDWLTTYNVFVPEANGSGALGEIGQPLIGQPLIGHTDTFLSIGKFNDREEAEALNKYIKTKFARTMLGILKATQHNPKSTWKYVPLQDFTKKSDINWSKSIPEIDQQLYKKYNLSPEEIKFIETHVKEMD